MPARNTLELFAPFFENLTDPRLERSKRHSLLDILILAVCATLGNANGWVDIERFGKAKLSFFHTFLELPNGIPSHDTFGRVFARLDPAALMACIQEWLDALGGVVAGDVVAIDGKTLRGSFDTAAGKNPLHLVSAWASEARLTLGQVAVDSKSNEITAIPLLLELLDLRGAIVSIDAMGCQKEIAKRIVARGGDYVLAVKGNPTTEVRYYVGSRRMGVRRYAKVLRGHWRIENNLHWQLDISFGEDGSRIQDRNAAENFALLRKLALGLLKQNSAKLSIARKRKAAALNPDFLRETLTGAAKVEKI